MHKPESFLKNETNKILCDFEIKTDYQIPARRLNLVIVIQKKKKKRKKEKKKRTCRIVDFAHHRMKIKEHEKSDKNLDLIRKLRKL